MPNSDFSGIPEYTVADILAVAPHLSQETAKRALLFNIWVDNNDIPPPRTVEKVLAYMQSEHGIETGFAPKPAAAPAPETPSKYNYTDDQILAAGWPSVAKYREEEARLHAYLAEDRKDTTPAAPKGKTTAASKSSGKAKQKRLTDEETTEAVQLVLEEGLSLGKVATQFGVSKSAIQQKVNAAREAQQ